MILIKKIKFNDKELNNIKNMFLQDETITNISNKYKCSRGVIRERLKDMGVYYKKRKTSIPYNFTDKEIDSIISMYTEQLMSTTEISNKYNCDSTTILRVLNQNGINTSPIRSRCNFTKYHVNENYFDYINSEEKAYWLGFIVADGHISVNNHLMITLAAIDKEHIYKFRNSIESTHPIKYIEKYNSYNITIGCSQIAHALRSKGINNRKSWHIDINTLIDSIPNNLVHHSIRGYIDGDGSIGTYKQTYYNKPLYNLSIVGVKELLNFICNELKVKNKIRHDKRTVNSHVVYIGSKSEIKRIRDYLYQDANIYLKRKKDEFFKI